MTEKPVRDSQPLLNLLRLIGRKLQVLPPARSWMPVLAWMGGIWILSSHAPHGYEDSSPWSSLLTNFGHAPLFGFLALILCLALPRQAGWPRLCARHVAWILLFILGYGLIDEVHQSFTEGRHASALDICTDMVGAACTLWMVGYLGRADSTEGGLWLRILIGLALCLATALGATLGGA